MSSSEMSLKMGWHKGRTREPNHSPRSMLPPPSEENGRFVGAI